MADILISAPDLSALLHADAAVAVLDVRWRLDKPDGSDDHRAGHIPGAVYVDLDTELATHRAPADGRHPLPSREALQAAAQRWGIDPGDTVVVYDDLGGMSAARAWWLLTDAGVADVRVLDGGLAAWRDAGLALESGDVTPEPGTIELSAGRLARLEIDEAAGLAADGILLDVRAAERYRGEVEPIDPRAGHIPGALSAPTTGVLGADRRFLPADDLRARFAALGVTDAAPVGVYCGSGVTAAHTAFALTLAGFAPALYAGSWSQWSNHPDRPVATGAEPGAVR